MPIALNLGDAPVDAVHIGLDSSLSVFRKRGELSRQLVVRVADRPEEVIGSNVVGTESFGKSAIALAPVEIQLKQSVRGHRVAHGLKDIVEGATFDEPDALVVARCGDRRIIGGLDGGGDRHGQNQ